MRDSDLLAGTSSFELCPHAGRIVSLALLVALFAACEGCGDTSPSASRGGLEDSSGAKAPESKVWFRAFAENGGVDFVHHAGTPGRYFMPEIIGSGCALFDFDRDGRLDLYLIQNAEPDENRRNRLYRLGPDGRFVDVSANSGVDVSGRGMGAAAGDVDNDGWVDLLVTEYGRARLFRNEHDGTFRDVTESAGIDNPSWGTSAAFFDPDRDGLLDLIIVNYVVYSPTRICTDHGGRRDFCGPQPFPGSAARFFHNTGGFRFVDRTIESGLARKPGPGLGIISGDFDGDDWPDVFVANDGAPNHLWINNRDGTFREEATLRGLGLGGMGEPQADMGVAAGDVDGDGLFDLYSTHLTDELHSLWRQGPRGMFSDSIGASGLARARWRGTGFGAVLADFDNDGALDLAQANGRVKFVGGPSPPGEPFWAAYRERNQLFRGRGDGTFEDISNENPALSLPSGVGRALAAGDFDDDGGLDLVVTEVAGHARILRNGVPNRGHWLMVRAVEPNLGGRDAYGATITVTIGAARFERWVQPGSSYLVSQDPRAHFGLGASARYDAIQVLWPNGSRERFEGGVADRVVVLQHGEGEAELATRR